MDIEKLANKGGALINKNKIIMKLKRLILAFLILFPWMTACAAFLSTSPPTPVVKFPFDVSKRDSTVNQEFRIPEYRTYYFALRFDYFCHDDLRRVLLFDAITIPIHLKIIKLDTGNSPPELKYEDTITTNGTYAHAYEWKQTNENYLRKIIAIDLKPGIYRVEANTIEDRPKFSETPSYLQIEGYPNTKFFPDSIK